MRLSDDKISHLTHIALKGLLDKKAVTPLVEELAIRREIKRVIVKELKLAEEIDEGVRKKLQSYSKKIPEGSPEWDLLYQRFFQEGSAKRGRG
ncbi:MAG: DUF507 family protein [Nitrospiraceae bacterium]|nr:MAG: DUF507 family protein [Nitrospiraceae bacterium]